METIRNVAVLEVVEGYEVGPYGACELKRACLFPAEGLACWECEG